MEFIKEREVFVKESTSKNYSVGAYYLAKLMLEIPLMILLPTIENILTYHAVGYRREAMAFF